MTKKTETRPATGHINPFGLRMQPDLRERLEMAAAASGRSLNAEVVARLEASFPITSYSTSDPLAPMARIEAMAKEMHELSQFIRESQDALREEMARRDALEKASARKKR